MFKQIGLIIKHYFVHAFGLALSLSAIYHTMTSFSDDPIFKMYFGIGGVFAGLSIQFLWGLAAAYRKRGSKPDRRKALSFRVIAILCICIFDFLSAFSIMAAQVNKTEQQYSILAGVKAELDADIRSIDNDIETKKKHQDAEFTDNNGRGGNYDKFQVEIDAKQAQIDTKKIALDKVKAEMNTLDKSNFALLSEKTGIASFWFELTMCIGFMFLIYFIPLLTPWKISLPGESVTSNTGNAVTGNSVTVTSNTVKKPKLKVMNETSATVTNDLCHCGRMKPVTHHQCGACRTKASRDNKKGEATG
jgi:hypothetical protein